MQSGNCDQEPAYILITERIVEVKSHLVQVMTRLGVSQVKNSAGEIQIQVIKSQKINPDILKHRSIHFLHTGRENMNIKKVQTGSFGDNPLSLNTMFEIEAQAFKIRRLQS